MSRLGIYYWVLVQRILYQSASRTVDLFDRPCVAQDQHQYILLFSILLLGRKGPRGGQQLTWRDGMRKLTLNLGKTSFSCLCDWDAKDPPNSWLAMLKDVTVNREQWRFCCHLPSIGNGWKSASVQLDCIPRVCYYGVFFFWPQRSTSCLLYIVISCSKV